MKEVVQRKFNKGLFDFIGYMSFFNPVGTGAAGDSKANREVLFDDVQECSSAEEFAEKHADEFDSVEDAEEFWEDN